MSKCPQCTYDFKSNDIIIFIGFVADIQILDLTVS